MNRRSFFATLFGGMAVALLPKAPKPKLHPMYSAMLKGNAYAQGCELADAVARAYAAKGAFTLSPGTYKIL